MITNEATLMASEQKARRAASRVGLKASKSRAGLSLNNRGGFQLIDPDRNLVVDGVDYNLSPADVLARCSFDSSPKEVRRKYGCIG